MPNVNEEKDTGKETTATGDAEELTIRLPAHSSNKVFQAFCHSCGCIVLHRSGIASKRLRCPICREKLHANPSII